MIQIEDKKQLNICKNCRWYSKSILGEVCNRTKTSYTDPVTGKVTYHAYPCSIERSDDPGFGCGYDGKHFEPKETLAARIINFFKKGKQ